MKMIIFEELVYQEALRRKMTVAPAQVRRAEADFRKQFANPDGIQRTFAELSFNGSVQLLEEKIRRSLLIEALLKNEVDTRCAVTPAEVRAFYEKNPARFRHAETFTIPDNFGASATEGDCGAVEGRPDPGTERAEAGESNEDGRRIRTAGGEDIG